MRVLVLVGKNLKDSLLASLFSGFEYTVARYASVSRGVRRLEGPVFEAVVVIPDAGDESWLRAVERIHGEHGQRPLLVLPCDDIPDEKAVDAGAFAVYPLSAVTPGLLRQSLRHLRKQEELEARLKEDATMIDWAEKTARFGTWKLDSQGHTSWSKGLQHIFEDKALRLEAGFDSARRFVHPDDLEIYDQANKATFDQGWPLDFEYRIIRDGNIRHLHLHRRVNLGKDGKVESAYGMARDVTAEREFENFLFKRDAILQVVGRFADRFLRESDWESGIDNALKNLGKAADVTRIFIFSKASGPDSNANITMSHEWAAPSVEPVIGKPEITNQPFSPTYDRWRDILLRRRPIAGHVRNFREQERRIFEMSQAKSVLLVPVFVGNSWWGFIGVSEHREEREWQPVEIESLTMVADMFGAAIQRSAMEDELKAAKQEAEDARVVALEASKTKGRFLANMSHEIRTPISGILGMAEMTITTGLTVEQREHMDMIRDAAKSLLAIVNDILDLSKIEAAKLELKPVDFDLPDVMERVVRPFYPEANRKGVALRYRLAGDVPAMVHGDPDRLGQVLRNLISNAIKFTERGYVDVVVEVAERDAGRVGLNFAVSDTGEGIPKEHLGEIFDSFTQLDGSTRKKHQGTGLGLAISRELVEMMGGDILVDSESGKGSTFTFSAWFAIPGGSALPAREAGRAVPETMHLHILLAEDNPLNQKFLTHFLTMFGHTVTVAENGAIALEELRRQGRKIDLVLMDIQMPEMGGFEATRAIRQSDGGSYNCDIPIIALTAYAMEGDRERMLAEGMNDYVSKPVDMKALSSAIARCMAERRQAGDRVCPPPVQTVRERVEADGVAVELDMDSLVDRFDGNMELLRDILELFLMEADLKLAKLDAGARSRDAEEMGSALHSITNIASHVMARDLMERTRELEKKCLQNDIDAVRAGIVGIRPQFLALIAAVRARLKLL